MNDAELAFMAWQVEEEKARQKDVVIARNYYNGHQDTFMTERMREFLNAKDQYEFNLNVCRMVVDAVTERLVIQGAASDELGDTKPLAEWASGLYAELGMGILQTDVHDGTGRDGEYFVMVDWDVDEGRPRFVPHHRYTDAMLDGDGFGCKAHYPDDDPRQPMLYASKRWTEKLSEGRARQRLNLYYADRVEKYELKANVPVAYQDPGDAGWPIPWVDSSGAPLGIPVIHFQNSADLRPEHWDAIPLQKAINKSLIDLLATADATAFRIFVALGWIPTSDGQPLKPDGSNAARLAPGQIIGTTKSASEVSFAAVEGSSVQPLIEMIVALLGWLAMVSSTPSSRVQFTRQIAAEGTLKEQNESLFAKARKRQAMLNLAWVRCFNMARRLANTFGGAGIPEDAHIVMAWEPLQSRDTTDERDEWRVKKELGVPLEQIWGEMGYSPEQIEAMKQTDEHKARTAMLQLGMDASQG